MAGGEAALAVPEARGAAGARRGLAGNGGRVAGGSRGAVSWGAGGGPEPPPLLRPGSGRACKAGPPGPAPAEVESGALAAPPAGPSTSSGCPAAPGAPSLAGPAASSTRGTGLAEPPPPVLGARGLPVLCQPRFAGVWEGRTRLCLRVPFFPFPSSPWEGCGAGQAFAVLEKSRPPLALVANGCRGFLLQRKEALPGAVTMQHRNLSTFDGQMQPCDSSGDLFTLKLSGFYAGAFP